MRERVCRSVVSAGERNEGGEARNESAFGGENVLYVVTNKTASLSRKERDAVFAVSISLIGA